MDGNCTCKRYILAPKFLGRRAELGLSWRDMVRLTGHSRNPMFRYLRGEIPAAPDIIAKLEQVLQLEPGSLIDPDQDGARKRAQQDKPTRNFSRQESKSA